MKIKKNLIIAATILVSSTAFAQAPESLTYTFDEMIDRTVWCPWTNDKNELNGWYAQDGYLTQREANNDESRGGNRTLICLDTIPFPDMGEHRMVLQSDLFLMDYEGPGTIGQGFGYGFDPLADKPVGYFDIILQKSLEEESTGLVVRCGEWQSDVTPYEVELYSWNRLRAELVLDKQGVLNLSAKVWPSGGAEPEEYQLIEELPGEARFVGRQYGLVTTAEAGQGRNPYAAFDNVQCCINDQFIDEELEVIEPSSIIQSQLNYFADYMKQWPESRIGFDGAPNMYRKILDLSPILLEKVPAYERVNELKWAQLLSLGGLQRWEEYVEKAEELADNPDTKDWINGHPEHDLESQRLYHVIGRLFRSEQFSDCVNTIDVFLKERPDDPRAPELHRVLCHCLFHLPEQEERYWEVTNDFIENEVMDDQVDDIMYNQAVYLQHQYKWKESLEIVDAIFEKFPATHLFPVLFDARFGNLYRLGELDGLKVEATTLIELVDPMDAERAAALYYLGILFEQQPPRDRDMAKACFDTILFHERPSNPLHGYTLSQYRVAAAGWRIHLARSSGENEQEVIAPIIRQLINEPFKEDPGKDKMIRDYSHLLNTAE